VHGDLPLVTKRVPQQRGGRAPVVESSEQPWVSLALPRSFDCALQTLCHAVIREALRSG
jgi:hypothetical protein